MVTERPTCAHQGLVNLEPGHETVAHLSPLPGGEGRFVRTVLAPGTMLVSTTAARELGVVAGDEGDGDFPRDR